MTSIREQYILVVDDSDSDYLITKRCLSKINLAIRTIYACSGEVCFSMLQSGDPLPALLLLDLKMLGVSGIEMLRRIRGDKRLSHLPVIIVTNSALEADREKALEAGANDYLHKDFDIDTFSRNLEVLIQRWLKK